MAIIGIASNALAIYYVFAQPWTDAMSTKTWQIWLIITSVIIISIGLIVYQLSKKKAIIHVES